VGDGDLRADAHLRRRARGHLSREAIITSMISGWRKNRKVTPID
jgi:hypothetical protein